MIDWDKIEGFIGYGNPEAPIVFLGMEEGLRRDADLEADLQSRSRYDPYMDLAAAQTQLDGPGAYFGHAPITQKTWRPMCHLMLRWNGIEHPNLDQRLRYQADHLGRRGDDSLLTELLPYPHSDSGQWLYARFDRFKTREAYAGAVIPRRQAVLRRIFSDREPDVIVAYGKGNWIDYQGIFRGASWEVDGPFAFTKWGKTRVVLTHALSGRQFNTDAQLDRFAEIALRHEGVSKARSELELQTLVTTVPNSGATAEARRRANHQFRESFATLVRAYRSASGLSPEAVSDKARAFAGQGNPGGVRNFENGSGWVDPTFAHGVFLAVGIPQAEALAKAYAGLKSFFRGVTKERD